MKFGGPFPQNFLIHIDGELIECVDRMKVLGIVLDDKLCYTYHINKMFSNITFTLRRLYSLNIYMPFRVRCRVAHALLMSQLSYCLEIFSCTSSGNIRRIELLMNKIIRFVFQLKRRDHVSRYVIQFLGCPFSSFLIIKMLLSFYKVIRNSTPYFLLQHLQFIHSSRNVQIFIPRIYNSIFEKSLLVKTARIWNHLPASLKLFRFSPAVYRRKLIVYFNSS